MCVHAAHHIVSMFIVRPGCGAVITVPGTVFTSTNYPNKYPNNEDCSRVIRFDAGKTVHLSFLHFDIEAHGSCG